MRSKAAAGFLLWHLLIACGRSPKNGHESTQRLVSAHETARSTEGRAPAADSLHPVITDDAWRTDARLALLQYLARERFGASQSNPASVMGCEDTDDDSEQPPDLAVAARFRILDIPPVLDSGRRTMGSLRPRLTFRVEVVSAARLTLLDTVGPELPEFSYLASVGVATDTLGISLLDVSAPRGRWELCPGPDFAQPGLTYVHVLRWEPSATSWTRIKQIADSVTSVGTPSR